MAILEVRYALLRVFLRFVRFVMLFKEQPRPTILGSSTRHRHKLAEDAAVEPPSSPLNSCRDCIKLASVNCLTFYTLTEFMSGNRSHK